MRVLITGCSSGFGRETAIELARRGHEVVATARRPETLADLDVASKLALDVDSDESVRAAVAQAGDVDVLVNNAGWSAHGPIEKVPLEAVRRMFETNFFGAARMIQALAPKMRARKSGVIANVSSMAGRVAAPLMGFYSASKFALEALSEALHLELGHFGIRVIAIEPGFVKSSFRDNASRYGVDDAPYDELQRAWAGADEALIGGERPGPEIVGVAIADAIEGAQQRLRWPVGKDAELVLQARGNLDDAAFEEAMRGMLKLEW
ncbi:MAG: SDR family oxidoreductase [Deltaproteobacteria bacterium]|jgi:NAD(P)-dependent dehydrogenase (short-subunit alcohol dehydrogenase family)|nr:SDR family oxidoreductase [Deltaproteobacteria bacterium]